MNEGFDFGRIGNAIASAAAFIRFKTRAYASQRMFKWTAPNPMQARPRYRAQRRNARIEASAKRGHTRQRTRIDLRPTNVSHTIHEKDFKGRRWDRRVNA